MGKSSTKILHFFESALNSLKKSDLVQKVLDLKRKVIVDTDLHKLSDQIHKLSEAIGQIILFIILFSIYLSLTNFISSYNQTSLPQTARLVSNIRCDQQHCGMLLSLTPDI